MFFEERFRNTQVPRINKKIFKIFKKPEIYLSLGPKAAVNFSTFYLFNYRRMKYSAVQRSKRALSCGFFLFIPADISFFYAIRHVYMRVWPVREDQPRFDVARVCARERKTRLYKTNYNKRGGVWRWDDRVGWIATLLIQNFQTEKSTKVKHPLFTSYC